MPTEKSLSKINWEVYDYKKVFPERRPFWTEDHTSSYAFIRFHRRMKEIWGMNLFTGDWEKREKLLPPDFTSIIAIGARYPVCPLCFNTDVYQGGYCFGCIYCFSIRTEQSLLSAFFDNWSIGMRRHAPIPYVKSRLMNVLNGQGRSVLHEAARLRVPIRLGNRSENFMKDERHYKVSLEGVLSVIKDLNYPLIINTKSDLLIEDPWFSALGEIADHLIVQVSIASPYDEHERRLTPFGPSGSRRWEVIKKLNESGIYAVPRYEPMMVTIHDDFDKTLELYAQKAQDAGCKHVFGDTLAYEFAGGITQLFASKGYDFMREIEVASDWNTLIHMLLNKATKVFNKYGIEYSTLKYGQIPFTDRTDCCGGDMKFGDVSLKFNVWHAIWELVKGKRKTIGFQDLVKEHPPIAKKFYKCVHDIWAGTAASSMLYFMPVSCNGIYVADVDANREPIYAYDEKLAFDSYYKVIEEHKLWEMVS